MSFTTIDTQNGTKGYQRRHSIPVLYTRGTHYEIGFDVGRTFGSLIKGFLDECDYLNNTFIPLYNTKEGLKIYNETLESVKSSFPQYIREIQGTADGAKVEFYKLFLLHMDDILPNALEQRNGINAPVGCSSICVNEPDNEILGHTEDALALTINYFYLVSAHVVDDEPQGKYNVREERFTSLCYAGHLPGYTMSYNHHGLIFSINTLSPKILRSGKTPRYFITRALLAAENFVQAQQILRDDGVGAAEGCSINMTFLRQEGDRLFHNAEMGPAAAGENQSQLNVLTVSPGESFIHVNKYTRLSVKEIEGLIIDSSNDRIETFKSFPRPKTAKDVIKMLSDESHKRHRVFSDSGPDGTVKTIAVGIFNCIERTWSIYSDNPSRTEPLIVLPLQLKK